MRSLMSPKPKSAPRLLRLPIRLLGVFSILVSAVPILPMKLVPSCPKPESPEEPSRSSPESPADPNPSRPDPIAPAPDVSVLSISIVVPLSSTPVMVMQNAHRAPYDSVVMRNECGYPIIPGSLGIEHTGCDHGRGGTSGERHSDGLGRARRPPPQRTRPHALRASGRHLICRAVGGTLPSLTQKGNSHEKQSVDVCGSQSAAAGLWCRSRQADHAADYGLPGRPVF